jgi:metallo-beta-lactamase class B
MKIMPLKILFYTGCLIWISLTAYGEEYQKIIISNDLEIVQISDHVLLHISYLEQPGSGRFPCNGLIFTEGDSAVVIDTPVNDSLSGQLLSWLYAQGYKVKAVIPTHWHIDNLGGLHAFHEAGIRSYAYFLTIKLAAQHNYTVPEIPFYDSFSIALDGKNMECRFLGPGHSLDNIVVWIPFERILFGGCLVKAVFTENLGNIADADVDAWPDTILEVMKRYPDADIVIPGHGEPGGKQLLWHTYQLLRPK